MARAKWAAILLVVLAAAGIGLWYVLTFREEPPALALPATKSPSVPLSSPLDLSSPPPPIHVASPAEAPPPIEVKEPAIRGWVRDSQGGPIADAAVTVYNNDKGIHKTFTDQAGAFAVGELQEADYRVSAQKEHFNEGVEEKVQTGRDDVKLILTGTSTAAGHVADEQGNSVAEFELVYLKQPPDDQALWKEIVRSQRTGWTKFRDPNGRFEVSDVGSGAPFALGARAQGFEPAFVTVPAAEPGQPAPSSMIILKTEARVSGQVLSPNHTPVAGAVIYLGSDQDAPVVSESGMDGRFSLTGLGDSPIELTASHDEYLPGTARAVPKRGAEVPVKIVLGQGGKLEGTVWKGEAPAAGQTVVALRLSSPRIRKQAVTDEEGRYQIAGVGLGLVEVLAKWKGPDGKSGPLRLQQQAEIEANKTTVVDFYFTSGLAVLEGAITSNGEAVSFAEIHGTVSAEEGQSSFSSTAREDGFFHIESIMPGTAWVSVTARAGQAELRRNFMIELCEGQTAYQDVSFDTKSGVSGLVSNLAPGEVGQVLVLPGHETLDMSTLEAIQELDTIKSGEGNVGRNGLFTIKGIEPGSYTLVALVFAEEADTGDDAMDSIRIAVQRITVSASSMTDATLTLTPSP